jgi:hypothetical protein
MAKHPSAKIIPFPVRTDLAGKELLLLRGSGLLNRILEDRQPERLVRSLADGDFFWIVQQVGEEDCLPLLELADEEQWEHLLDLANWEGDRIDADRTLIWLRRLAEADPDRLSAWLSDAAEGLFSLLLLRKAEVVVKDAQEEAELPRGYFTLDGRYYIRALEREDHDALETLLRILAERDPEALQHLLFNLAALLPAEAEEELYRRRNVRLAEHGFLPAEEAIGIYAPLSPAALGAEEAPLAPGAADGGGTPMPAAALMHIGERGLVSAALSEIGDSPARDRVLLEVSGLCNRLIAAEGLSSMGDPERFASLCERAAGYVNVAMESLCGGNAAAAAELLKNHSLQTIFRVGYGYATDLHRQARRWRRESWFGRQGRGNDFWGSPWAPILDGLMLARPRCYAGAGAPAAYRDFASRADLDEAARRLRQVMALDRLLSRLTGGAAGTRFPGGQRSFPCLLFNRWACKVLGREPSPEPLSPADGTRFFRELRKGEAGPPYRMPGRGGAFAADFMAGAADFEPEARGALREALDELWERFREEYEAVAERDLDGRLSELLLIAPA